jgi:hypothetical protein
MTTPRTAPKGKSLIRALVRRGTAGGKVHAGEAIVGRQPEPRACDRCGAILRKRVWRTDLRPSRALLDRVTWTVCPACRQAATESGQGRIILEGSFVDANREALRARIRNVAARAARTQPQRRIVAMGRTGDVMEVLTSSQKLAHRLVRELEKAFRGRTTYAWSDDGTLFARWRRDDAPARRTYRVLG